MSFKIISIVAFLAILGSIYAQNGQPCHASFFNFTPRHSLNISEYMGDWYIQETACSDIGNCGVPDYKCARRSLSLPNVSDTDNFVAIDSYVNITNGVYLQEAKEISVNATRSPLSAIWYMTDRFQAVDTDIIILAADLEFKEWTVIYSCSIRGPDAYRYEVTLALTRNRTVSQELKNTLKALMVGVGFRIGDHSPIDQTDC